MQKRAGAARGEQDTGALNDAFEAVERRAVFSASNRPKHGLNQEAKGITGGKSVQYLDHLRTFF
jgi:hypothetical protein